MDTDKLAVLEGHLAQLIQAFTQVKADNVRLTQNLAQLQHTVHEQQRTLERWQVTQEELKRVRLVAQTLQGERELIRARLADMLVAIERLERLAHVPSDA
jgi:hypothetical protein